VSGGGLEEYSQKYEEYKRFYEEEYTPAFKSYTEAVTRAETFRELYHGTQVEKGMQELAPLIKVTPERLQQIITGFKERPEAWSQFAKITQEGWGYGGPWLTARGAPTPPPEYPELVEQVMTRGEWEKAERIFSASRRREERLGEQKEYVERIKRFHGGEFPSGIIRPYYIRFSEEEYLTKTIAPLGMEEAQARRLGYELIPEKQLEELTGGEFVERLVTGTAPIWAPVAAGFVAAPVLIKIGAGAGWVASKVGAGLIKVAAHTGPATAIILETKLGAMKFATPYIAQQIGLTTMTGIEMYKTKKMYEAGVPVSGIAAAVATDVAIMGLFATGFAAGAQARLPPRFERALIGEKKLFIKGKYKEYPIGEYIVPGEPGITYKLPSITYPEGAEAYYRKVGGIFSKLTRPYGRVPIEPGMTLPTSVISLPSGEIAKEWTLVPSMRLQQVEQWAKLQVFKTGVPLEKGMEAIDTRLIGVQQLGKTQSVKYWAGVSTKRVEYFPFEGELYEPWTATKFKATPLSKYILAPEKLVAAPMTDWARIQMDVKRAIYPAGILYPQKTVEVLDKAWYTTKMYEVGRAMDQSTSLALITPKLAMGESLSKTSFELIPYKRPFIGGTGPIGWGAEATAGLKISDTISVAGGSSQQTLNWAQRDILKRQMQIASLSSDYEEAFSIFIGGVGLSQRQFTAISSALTQTPALAQIPALAKTPVQISTQVPIVAAITTTAQATAQIQALTQIQTPIQKMIPVHIVPTITPPIPTTPPPIIPYFPSKSGIGKLFVKPKHFARGLFRYHYKHPMKGLDLKFPKGALAMPKMGGVLKPTKTKRRRRR
jgi:hypothetical protein